jgi:hypothetical protein
MVYFKLQQAIQIQRNNMDGSSTITHLVLFHLIETDLMGTPFTHFSIVTPLPIPLTGSTHLLLCSSMVWYGNNE